MKKANLLGVVLIFILTFILTILSPLIWLIIGVYWYGGFIIKSLGNCWKDIHNKL